MIAEVTNDLRSIFAEQRRRYRDEPNPPLRERLARLEALERSVRRHRQALYVAMRQDFRKAPEEVELTEIRPTLDELVFARKNLARWMRPKSVTTPIVLLGARSEVRYEPKGVALIIAPWNYPIVLTLAPLVAALAAGNRAVVRVSEKVPHTRAVLASIVTESFSPGDVAFVGGDVDVAEALLELPFDHFFFTGSTRVGKRVMHAAAEHLASVTLELGGKSPAVVHDDADLKRAAGRIAWGKFVNAGQTCIAPDYVLAHESIARPLIDEIKLRIERMYGAGEEARATSHDFARIVDEAAFDRLDDVLEESIRRGARIEIGGSRERVTRYIAPTVVSDVDYEAPLMREEIFGPILPVLTYRSLDAALDYVKSHDKPLALYVFSRSKNVVERVVRGAPAGGGAVNDTLLHFVNPHLPFGGAGPSGLGNYHGHYGFRAFSHERANLTGTILTPLLFPPYSKLTRGALRLIDRFL